MSDRHKTPVKTKSRVMSSADMKLRCERLPNAQFHTLLPIKRVWDICTINIYVRIMIIDRIIYW